MRVWPASWQFTGVKKQVWTRQLACAWQPQNLIFPPSLSLSLSLSLSALPWQHATPHSSQIRAGISVSQIWSTRQPGRLQLVRLWMSSSHIFTYFNIHRTGQHCSWDSCLSPRLSGHTDAINMWVVTGQWGLKAPQIVSVTRRGRRLTNIITVSMASSAILMWYCWTWYNTEIARNTKIQVLILTTR